MYAYLGKQTNTIPAEVENIKKDYQEGVFRWLNFWI